MRKHYYLHFLYFADLQALSFGCHFCLNWNASQIHIEVQDVHVSWPQPYSQDFKCAIKYDNCTSITPPEQHLFSNPISQSPTCLYKQVIFTVVCRLNSLLLWFLSLNLYYNCDNEPLSKVFAIISITRSDKPHMIYIYKTKSILNANVVRIMIIYINSNLHVWLSTMLKK